MDFSCKFAFIGILKENEKKCVQQNTGMTHFMPGLGS
jgi:hypothetical protein